MSIDRFAPSWLFLVLLALLFAPGGALGGGHVSLVQVGEFRTGKFDEGAAEISAYDPGSRRLFVTNAHANTLDVLDLSDPASPVRVAVIELAPFGEGVNSVAVHKGLVAGGQPRH